MAQLSPRIEWILQCCGCSSFDIGDIDLSASPHQILLTTDYSDHKAKHTQQISRADSFDITFSPRNSLSSQWALTSITPRQRDLRNTLELPDLHTQPVPPNSSPDDLPEEREHKLLEMYKEFAIELHTGVYLTQLTSNREYSDIHCQLMEDMQTLKLDQSNGRIIEFPLTGVSKVYRIVKNDDRWYMNGKQTASNVEHIVVVEFMRRKLAFVFKSLQMSQRFLMCMELLIRRAQQKQAKKALRSLTHSFPQATTPIRQDPSIRAPPEPLLEHDAHLEKDFTGKVISHVAYPERSETDV